MSEIHVWANLVLAKGWTWTMFDGPMFTNTYDTLSIWNRPWLLWFGWTGNIKGYYFSHFVLYNKQ